jgi:hypothetical protein
MLSRWTLQGAVVVRFFSVGFFIPGFRRYLRVRFGFGRTYGRDTSSAVNKTAEPETTGEQPYALPGSAAPSDLRLTRPTPMYTLPK